MKEALSEMARSELAAASGQGGGGHPEPQVTHPQTGTVGGPSHELRRFATRVELTFVVNRDPLHRLFEGLAAVMAGSGAFYRLAGQILHLEPEGPRPVKARALPALLARFVELRFVRVSELGAGEILGYGLLDPTMAQAFARCPELVFLPEWTGPVPEENSRLVTPAGCTLKHPDLLLAAANHPLAPVAATATTWVERLEASGHGPLFRDNLQDRSDRGKATWLAKVFAASLAVPLELPNGTFELVREYPRGPHAKPLYHFSRLSPPGSEPDADPASQAIVP